jgi:hypothetical protein
VIYRTSSSIRTKAIRGCTKAILGCLSGMTFACGLAQAPQTEVAAPAVARVPAVALVAGGCPAVAQGGAIAFDWNPGFDPAWAVTGMQSFRLIFQGVGEDGVSLNPASRLMLDSGPRGRMTDIGNGYFHVEARVPRATHAGVYRLVGAHSAAAVAADATGEAPTQTVSPVGESYCMTVVAGTRAQATVQP